MKKTIWVFLGMLSACAVVAFLGALSNSAALSDGWYDGLIRPSWNPPREVFPPVWSTLYFLMAVAGTIAWCAPEAPYRRAALACFAIQLILNALWSFVFFGMREPGLAMVEMFALWTFILATVVLFWRVSPAASVLLWPYFGWVTFALFLNFSIWYLNP